MSELPNITESDLPTLVRTLKCSGSGASRNVYLLPDGEHVLKVDRKNSGPEQYGGCDREAEIWRDADPELREYLAEVVVSGPGWLVMERCDKDEDVSESLEVPWELKEALKDAGIGDQHCGNVMRSRRTGRLVSVDYAYAEPTPPNVVGPPALAPRVAPSA